jgi:hypothetical protein
MKLPELPQSQFTPEKSADRNRVFLIKGCSEPPFLKAHDGWKIIGTGKAPWAKSGDDFALMLEKITPADHSYPSSKGEDFNEGDRIWHHWPKSSWEIACRFMKNDESQKP